ncbi:MAG: nucleotidyltransferase family protein [Thermoleophilaceae bacterium]
MKTRSRDLYARALVAVAASPPEGASLRAVAVALETYDSSARQALGRLVRDGVAALVAGRYRITSLPRSGLELERARYEVDPESYLRIVTRISAAVELAAFDPEARKLYLVTDPAADPSALVRLKEAIARVPQVAVDQHEALRTMGTTVEDLQRRRTLREQISRARLLKGDIDRALPLRLHADPMRGRPLGHVHPALAGPSRRAKQRLAQTYGLDEISLFGSATRRDFRPDSDVDALVHFRGGAVPTLGSYAALAQDLSRLLGRPVDVVDASSVEPAFIPTIERDRVTLYGKPHALVPRKGQAVRGGGNRRTKATRRRVGHL